jgi:hypothetical protein
MVQDEKKTTPDSSALVLFSREIKTHQTLKHLCFFSRESKTFQILKLPGTLQKKI